MQTKQNKQLHKQKLLAFKKYIFLHLNLVALPTISRYVIKNSYQIKSNTQKPA